MNAWAQLGATVLAQLVVAAFIYGMLTQRVKDQGGWLKAHEEKLGKHNDQLVNHESRIAHMEGSRGVPLKRAATSGE